MSDTKKGAFARVSEAKIYGLFDVGIGETMIAIDISKSYAKSIAKEINAAYAESVKGLVAALERIQFEAVDIISAYDIAKLALTDFKAKEE